MNVEMILVFFTLTFLFLEQFKDDFLGLQIICVTFLYSASHQLPSFLTERIESFHYCKVSETPSPPHPQNPSSAPLSTQHSAFRRDSQCE